MITESTVLTPTSIPFCINCEYIGTNGSGNWESYRCFAPAHKTGINLVTGVREYYPEFCVAARQSDTNNNNICGAGGKHFKRKEINSSFAVESAPFIKKPKQSIIDLL